MNCNKSIILLVLPITLEANISFGCKGLGGKDQLPDVVLDTRNALTTIIKNTPSIDGNEKIKEAIETADKCIEACNTEISKRGIEARKEGIPQIKGQATFLKNFLLALQEVQECLVSKENKLSEECQKNIADGDRYYRGEVGHLCIEANARLKELNQEIAEIGQ